MARIKRAILHAKRRKNVLKKAKGYTWGRKSKITQAQTAIKRAGVKALADRRKKKGVMRRNWQVNLNAALRKYEMSYSRFIDALKKKNIELDRKVLADLAVNHSKMFENLVKKIK